jgi:uncharacterized iron-regulated protein
MRSRRLAAVSLPLILVSSLHANPATQVGVSLPPGANPVPVSAIHAVVAALRQHQVVAIGESHNLKEAGDFYVRLVLSRAIAGAADDVVVEFGNARYQEVIDRYVRGASVPPARLRSVWQNTTQVGAWDAPMYRRLFAAVRTANLRKSSGERLHVLLADPPIDWSKVTSAADVDRFLLERERFMAHVIQRDVIERERHAVLIAGLAHVERSVPTPKTPDVTDILDRKDPGAVWVLGVHLGFPDRTWEVAIASWSVPSVATLRGTWIGRLPKGEGLAQDALDAMLYLGAPDSLHASIPLPSVYLRDGYWKTLKERWPLGVGGSFTAKKLFEPFSDAGYPGQFSQAQTDAIFTFAACMRSHGVEAFPDPQFQYDFVGFSASSLEEAHKDPDFPAAFKACSGALDG